MLARQAGVLPIGDNDVIEPPDIVMAQLALSSGELVVEKVRRIIADCFADWLGVTLNKHGRSFGITVMLRA